MLEDTRLSRSLEKDKEKRYQSAGELRSELIRIEEGIPTAEKVIPKRKPITSREITVTFGLRKLFIPALVVIALIIAAVGIDPEFAVAYRSIGAAYGAMDYEANMREYFQKAFELSDRLSDKERYWIQGDFYTWSEKTYDKAIEAYKKRGC